MFKLMHPGLIAPAGLILLFSLSACSTAQVNVVPGDSGVNHAIARDAERDGAELAAAEAAIGHCEDLGREPELVENENAALMGQQAGQTADSAGDPSAVSAPGHRAQISFRCR